MKLIIKGRLPGLNEYIEAERKNRYKAAAMKRENEAIVAWSAKASKLKKISGPVFMRYTWYEPNRKRDKDNITFGRKIIQDALVKCGYLKGDGWQHIEGFSDAFGVDKKDPRIEVEIEEVKHGDL